MDEMTLQMQEAVFEMIFGRLVEFVTHSVRYVSAFFLFCVQEGLLVVFKKSD